MQGHSFVGVWLREECFSEPAIDEPLRFRKRVDLNEIAVFDPTCVTNRPVLEFKSSEREAKRRLQNAEEFLCVIDVFQARKQRIRPLPDLTDQSYTELPATVQKHIPPSIPHAPDLSDLDISWVTPALVEAETEETPSTRLDRWRRRLLDLTLRNRLLNFKETKKTIPLQCPDLSSFEDSLSEGVSFKILPRPHDFYETDGRDAEVHRRRTGDKPLEVFLGEELKAKRLHAELTSEELSRRLLEVYRAARLELEEGGASALYLAVGFLAWYETPQSYQHRLAPILLLPIELCRKSVREGFSLRLGDDEPLINVTLLELLRQDHGINIPGLDTLPEDKKGFDVKRILHIFREAIRDIYRWDVIEEAKIGIFSFAKFLMWRDLMERSDDLLQNPVVNHLVNRPEQEFDPGAVFPDTEKLDIERSPLQTYCPLSADASQLAAVLAAADGRSFVLEGPPGTGKSQTIANLIAHCLAEGKSVLFVSEKMAALNVVHERLRKLGLESACLELHSHKANKSEVLRQLAKSLHYHHTQITADWEREARQVETLRNQLNAYVKALHKRRNTEETIFQATSRLIGLREVQGVKLHWESPDSINSDQLAKLRDLVGKLATAGGALSEVFQHPWEAAGRGGWTPIWEQIVSNNLISLFEKIGSLENFVKKVSDHLSFHNDVLSFAQLTLLYELSEVLLNSFKPPYTLLVQQDWEEIQSKLSGWIEHGRRRDSLRLELYETFSEDLLNLELEALQSQYERACFSRWPTSWWLYRPVRKALKSVSRERKAPVKEEIGELLKKACDLLQEDKVLASAADEARALLGRYWNDGEAEWERLEELCSWTERFRCLVNKAAGTNFEYASLLRERLARLITEGRDFIKPEGVIGADLLAYREAFQAFNEERNGLNERLDIDIGRAWGKEDSPDALVRAKKTVKLWMDHLAELRNWCAWRRVRAEAVQSNLAPLVEAYERGDFPSGDMKNIFDRSYYDWWHSAMVSNEPDLAQFFSPEHERKIIQFRKSDDRYLELTKRLIIARLHEKVPTSSTNDLPNSEMGILKREIGKKKRHMSVRKLFQTIPNLLPRLKPCLLMSPISVAQYVDAKYPPFDLVVFDEASQIPVWDAVGAIARGKQAVVVGDPKQLPPTSFFQRLEDEDEWATEAEAVEDLESILDDCISARLPQLSLNCHYRSRHESLIAFSNYHYYDNRLLTFPSPYQMGTGVSWVPVPEGVYDRGKSATNRAEAERIVQEIIRRLKDPSLSKLSIGVVTFSQAQQTLIENLLERERGNDPEVDSYFSEDVIEPVFVKNLENVQGDERDVILFSICYGPDAHKRVSMNFGPMNREGGERRLNVAITRARHEVMVFSTLRADQIDLARTRARGVRDLKNFLDYAERGPASILGEVRYDPILDFESPFEKAVYEVLVDKGWEVHQQVGCARYRIDLAVVDPDAHGSYLLGIECDGANYHRSKTARDRDKLREGVLRNLGWKLHRIWSTDWWTNPKQQTEKLLAVLHEAEEAKRHRKLKVVEPPDVKSIKFPDIRPIEQPDLEPRTSFAKAVVPQVDTPETHKRTYSSYPIERRLGNPEDFYQPASRQLIREVITKVAKHEGPISLELATRRVGEHWGIRKISKKAQSFVRNLVPSNEIRIFSSQGVFLWPNELDPDTYEIYRVPTENSESVRSAEDLPIQEVANSVLSLLRTSISAPVEDLVRGASRIFGFRRTGVLVENRMREGIDFLVQKGLVRREGTMVILED